MSVYSICKHLINLKQVFAQVFIVSNLARCWGDRLGLSMDRCLSLSACDVVGKIKQLES